MPCYFRHLKAIFEEVGIDVTKENRQKVDEAFHKVVGVDHPNCTAAWKKIKPELAGDEKERHELAERLRKALT